MSLLRKSETKQVETKTQKVSTPPKYLQSNLSSKGVRSTSYVHRTFVDAEAKVGPNDVRFELKYRKNKVWTMKKPKNSLQKLATAVGIENVPTTAKKIKKQISEQLSPENLDATLDKVKDLADAKNIYRLVFGNNPPNDMGLAAIKDKIRQDINENLEQVIDISERVKKTQQNKTKKAAPTEEETKTAKTTKTTKTTAKSQGETKSTGPTEPTEDEKQKTKFNEFWEIVKDMNKKDINNKAEKSAGDVKAMLKELSAIINKSGSIQTSLTIEGKKQGNLGDKDKNNFLSTTELRTLLRSDEKLKKLFKIGKTGELDENQEALGGWGTWFQSMDKNNDKIYSIQEFAKSYLAAALKNMTRDILIADEGKYAIETFNRMVALFGIAHPGAKTPPKTKVWYNGSPYTLRDLNKEETKWSLTDGVKRFKNGKGFDFEDISLIPPPAAPEQPVAPLPAPQPVKPPPEQPVDPLPPPPPVVPPPAPQTTLPTFNVVTPKLGDIVRSKINPLKERGLIGEISGTTAHVFWEDGSDDNNNELTDLVKVTISDDTESKIREIFDSYDTERTDGTLEDVEARNSLLDNIKATKVYRTLDQFNVDGIAGFSREEFRFLLTVREEIITNWDKKQKQRIREENAEKAVQQKMERQTRQKQEQARQDALKQKEEEVRQQKIKEEEAIQQKLKEEQAKQAALVRQEQAKQAIEDEKRIIVEFDRKKKEYVVRQTNRSKVYQKELEGIPTNVCNPK